ncbi:MAG TPA: monovalent cation/H(+) antiporter subunit G [Actinomycetota bacterium]|nr:monovalent cation/H(+) antiporter subunit G [Actinomycetota bacterium]
MRLVAYVLIMAGAIQMLLAGIGVLRLPDVFSRMHAGTKAASLGVACVLAGIALLTPDAVARLKLVVAIAFQFLTAPVAAHLIGRAAYRSGVPLFEGTRFDELAGASKADGAPNPGDRPEV